MWIAILDWFLAILYLILGFSGSKDNVLYICLGIIWFIIGYMNFSHRKKYKKRYD